MRRQLTPYVKHLLKLSAGILRNQELRNLSDEGANFNDAPSYRATADGGCACFCFVKVKHGSSLFLGNNGYSIHAGDIVGFGSRGMAQSDGNLQGVLITAGSTHSTPGKFGIGNTIDIELGLCCYLDLE